MDGEGEEGEKERQFGSLPVGEKKEFFSSYKHTHTHMTQPDGTIAES